MANNTSARTLIIFRRFHSYAIKNPKFQRKTIPNIRFTHLGVIQKTLDKFEVRKVVKKLDWVAAGGSLCTLGVILGKPYFLLGAVPAIAAKQQDIRLLARTFVRDMTFSKRYAQCKLTHWRIVNSDVTVPEAFKRNAELDPNKIILQVKDQNWRYKDIISYANRVSRLMQKYEMTKDDVCGLFMTNSPEMAATILGTAQVGIIGTIINTKLRRDALIKAINGCHCRMVIFDEELAPDIREIESHLIANVKLLRLRNKGSAKESTFEKELMGELDSEPEVFIKIHHNDPFLYLYTGEKSQKPIVITHEKFLFSSIAATILLNISSTDKIYNPVPFWVTSGITYGLGPAITKGIPVVLRPHFSPDDYFKDCYIYNCTVAHSCGNMWKKILTSQSSAVERFLPVKVLFGDGIDASVSKKLQNRFNMTVQEIGDINPDNCNMVNFEGKPGLIGFLPKWLPGFLFPQYLVKIFGEEKIPLRTLNGLCKPCYPGDPGFLVKLNNKKVTDEAPSNHRLLSNVNKLGDVGICSTKVYTLDENLYLKELKTEIERNKIPENLENIAESLTKRRCAFYILPGGENKRGLDILAIEDPSRQVDIKKLSEKLQNEMPRHFLPNYVRIIEKFELSVANEIQKDKLKDQGLLDNNPTYYFDEKSKSYEPLILKL